MQLPHRRDHPSTGDGLVLPVTLQAALWWESPLCSATITAFCNLEEGTQILQFLELLGDFGLLVNPMGLIFLLKEGKGCFN